MFFSSEQNLHRPPHLYLDGEIYFITCRTREKVKYFIGDRKNILKKFLLRAVEKYQVEIYGWAILDNHYHLLVKFRYGELGPRIDELRPEGSWIDELSGASRRSEIRYAKQRDKFRSARFVNPKRSPLAKFVQYVNCNSAREINKIDGRQGRNIWYQYWDTIIKDEKDFCNHFNYTHYNPIKHGLVKDFKELLGYPFCSYRARHDKLGAGEMEEILAGCPVFDYLAEDYGLTN